MVVALSHSAQSLVNVAVLMLQVPLDFIQCQNDYCRHHDVLLISDSGIWAACLLAVAGCYICCFPRRPGRGLNASIVLSV